MPPSIREYLLHILTEAEYLIRVSTTLNKAEFECDDTLKRAFVRSLEIIGEATKKVPNDFRQKYPQVDWRSIAGLRDRLIHSYFGVDYDIVWDIVVSKVPDLAQELQKILKSEFPSDSQP